MRKSKESNAHFVASGTSSFKVKLLDPTLQKKKLYVSLQSIRVTTIVKKKKKNVSPEYNRYFLTYMQGSLTVKTR
jgi:hypothetical protein